MLCPSRDVIGPSDKLLSVRGSNPNWAAITVPVILPAADYTEIQDLIDCFDE